MFQNSWNVQRAKAGKDGEFVECVAVAWAGAVAQEASEQAPRLGWRDSHTPC